MSTKEVRSVLSRFELATLDHFRFLIDDFACSQPTVERPDALSVDIRFANRTTGVQVSLELREQQVFVYLIRLSAGGEFPPYFRHADQWLYLEALARHANQDLPTQPSEFDPVSIETLVSAYATQAKQLSPEILRGDFHAFEDAKASAEHPE